MSLTFDVRINGTIEATGLTEQEYSATGLNAGTYVVEVRSDDAGTKSDWSEALTIEIEELITTYQIEFGPAIAGAPGTGGPYTQEDMVESDSTLTYTQTGIDEGVLYEARARTVEGPSGGEWSEWVQVQSQKIIGPNTGSTPHAESWTAEEGTWRVRARLTTSGGSYESDERTITVNN